MFEQTRQIFLASLARVANEVARLVPGLLAMLLVLALSLLVALLLRAAVRFVCVRLGLDVRARELGFVAPDGPSPTQLLARLTFWTVVALGFLVGLSGLEASTTTAVAARVAAYLPHLLLALVIGAVGLAAGRVLERVVLIGAVNFGLQSARLVGVGARWLVVVFAVAIALGELGIGGSVVTLAFGILFGGIVLALALALGLGAKDAVARSLEKHMAPREEKAEPEKDDLTHL